MRLNQISIPETATLDEKTKKALDRLTSLIEELNTKKITDKIVESINSEINEINQLNPGDSSLRKKLTNATNQVIKIIVKEEKLIPSDYYKNLWMGVGIAAFGVPMGVAIGTALGNMAYLGIGLAIGLPIGMAVGASMDEKAKKEERQLNWK